MMSNITSFIDPIFSPQYWILIYIEMGEVRFFHTGARGDIGNGPPNSDPWVT